MGLFGIQPQYGGSQDNKSTTLPVDNKTVIGDSKQGATGNCYWQAGVYALHNTKGGDKALNDDIKKILTEVQP